MSKWCLAVVVAASVVVGVRAEESPFYAERVAGKKSTPRPVASKRVSATPTPPVPAGKAVGRFFTDMFSFGLLGKPRGEGQSHEVEIVPRPISLENMTEVTVTYKFRNTTKSLVSLVFPTTQRLEVTLTNASGKTLWQSDKGREFAKAEGFVVVNPKEAVTFSELMPLAGLVAGEIYDVRVEIVGYPETAITSTIIPQP